MFWLIFSQRLCQCCQKSILIAEQPEYSLVADGPMKVTRNTCSAFLRSYLIWKKVGGRWVPPMTFHNGANNIYRGNF